MRPATRSQRPVICKHMTHAATHAAGAAAWSSALVTDTIYSACVIHQPTVPQCRHRKCAVRTAKHYLSTPFHGTFCFNAATDERSGASEKYNEALVHSPSPHSPFALSSPPYNCQGSGECYISPAGPPNAFFCNSQPKICKSVKVSATCTRRQDAHTTFL